MRNIITTLTLLFLCNAMTTSNANEADMAKMMQQAEAMQACFENIGEDKLTALEQEASKIEKSINALCKAGKSNQATQKAIEYAKKMPSDPTFKQIQQCAKDMEGLMPMVQPYLPNAAYVNENTNVCD